MNKNQYTTSSIHETLEEIIMKEKLTARHLVTEQHFYTNKNPKRSSSAEFSFQYRGITTKKLAKRLKQLCHVEKLFKVFFRGMARTQVARLMRQVICINVCVSRILFPGNISIKFFF